MSTALQPDAGASYREILRASALIGGSTLVGVAIGILRVKALALLLGTAGFGLYATYMTIVELARHVAQFGMNASGVREIAAAAARGDTTSLARTARVLLRCVLVCGPAAVVRVSVIMGCSFRADVGVTPRRERRSRSPSEPPRRWRR